MADEWRVQQATLHFFSELFGDQFLDGQHWLEIGALIGSGRFMVLEFDPDELCDEVAELAEFLAEDEDGRRDLKPIDWLKSQLKTAEEAGWVFIPPPGSS